MRLGNASTTVTGTVTPASVNTRVMPHLRPTRPMVIVNPHTAGSLWLPHSLRSVGGLGKRPQLPVGYGVRAHALRPLKWTADYIRIHPGFNFSAAISGGVAPAPLTGGAQRLIQFDLDVDPGGQFQLHEGVHGLVGGGQYVHQARVRGDLELIARILVAVRRSQHREALHFNGQRHGTLDGRAGAFRGIDDFACRLVDQTVIESLQPDPYVLIGHIFRSSASSAVKMRLVRRFAPNLTG